MNTPRFLPILISILIIVGAIFLEAPLHTAHADSLRGEVCVFQAPSGADGLGHVGWALLNTNPTYGTVGDWIYGAMEGPGLPPTISGDPQNGNWYQEGDWTTMQNNFLFGMNSNSGGELFSAGYYTDFTCMTTFDSNVGTAAVMFAVIDATPYQLAASPFSEANNCETTVINILSVYSTMASSAFSQVGSNLVNITDTATPNLWFGALASVGFSPSASVGSPNPISPDMNTGYH